MKLNDIFAIVVSVILLLGVSLPGQSMAPAPPQTSHVQGRVESFGFAQSIGAEVTFRGEKKVATLHTDSRSFYQTDLPSGLYTMTVNYKGLPEYRRPLFRAIASETVILNVTLHPEESCEETVPVQKSPLVQDQEFEICGEDRLPIPSKDGIPFELLIRFPSRQAKDRQYIYYGQHGGQIPVFTAYDLFTLEANRVTYNRDTHELEAAGNVISTNGSGAETRAEEATFKIEVGRMRLIR